MGKRIQREFTRLPGGKGVPEEGVQVGSRAWPLGLSISGGYPLFPAGTPCRNQGAIQRLRAGLIMWHALSLEAGVHSFPFNCKTLTPEGIPSPSP